ncbi:MAG: nucleotidyl transferase AbiEii/AbiGii toxin family protein [Deltaproteobacteria bacterium]|nr:nucleotidyl transferase AbiEii/AbiGii toxin family protein [Deltaproteobacteria bacterium]
MANRARERRLARDDGFVAYAMDRLLYRLGRSPQAGAFVLKGGVLVAHLVRAPHRFTRDIDVLRSHGPPDPDEMRRRFRDIVAVQVDDGVAFDPAGVRAVPADHDEDGYDGVKVFVRARIGQTEVDLRIDVGFGDALVPPAIAAELEPFLPGDVPARVLAYEAGPVVAEKVETLLSRFPLVHHRLKDLLDVVVMAASLDFDGSSLVGSLAATLARRGTPPDPRVLDDMRDVLTGRRWQADWTAMRREKAVVGHLDLTEAVARFDAFVRPLLVAVSTSATIGHWGPGGPWSTGGDGR